MRTITEMKSNIMNLSGNRHIYRIIPFERLLSILLAKKNTLVQTKKWDDPFENFLLNCELNVPGIPSPVKLSEQRDKWYGQCWTLQEQCDGLWRVYTQKGKIRGVRVKTTVGKLFNSFYNPNDSFAQLSYYIGKVKYIPKESINKYLCGLWAGKDITCSDNSGQLNSLLIKRSEFRYEQEVRLLYNDNNNQHCEYYSYNFEPNEVFESIMFNPWITKCEEECLTSILRKIGYSGKIEKSDLYDVQSPRILGYNK